MTKPGRNSEPTYTWAVWALGLLAAVLTYSLLVGPHGLPRLRALTETWREQSDQAYERIAANRSLQARLDGLRSDERALEEETRTSLGFVGPNEIVFILNRPDTSESR